jgi:hypothetical protein
VNSGLFDCEYENNLFNVQDHSAAIEELKAMARPEEGPSFCARLMARFSTKEEKEAKIAVATRAVETIENLEEKHVAHYHGLASHDAMHQLIAQKGMKGVHFSRSGKLAGLGIVEENKELAFKKAGAILLDAYDRGAEVLVVEDVDVLDMFKKNYAAIEKTVGRKIKGLELISANDFVSQVNSIAA